MSQGNPDPDIILTNYLQSLQRKIEEARLTFYERNNINESMQQLIQSISAALKSRDDRIKALEEERAKGKPPES